MRVCGACSRRHGQQEAARVIFGRAYRKRSVLRLVMACKAGRNVQRASVEVRCTYGNVRSESVLGATISLQPTHANRNGLVGSGLKGPIPAVQVVCDLEVQWKYQWN